MRFILTSLFLILVISCKSTDKVENPIKLNEVSLISGCPEDADCAIEIMENQRIHYRDEKETGRFYPEFKVDSTRNVIKMTYDKHRDQAAVDAQYREEIIFEWPKSKRKMELTNEELEKVHLTFGRFCFCEPKTVGHFKVKKGKLQIRDNRINLNFDNTQNSPQVIDSIVVKYSLF